MNIIFNRNGKGNLSPRINLSLKLLQKIGVNEHEREVDVKYNEEINAITIEKAKFFT